MENSAQFPDCMKCGEGVLIPLSDYGRDGASIRYKAWVCSNPECGYNIRIDNGEISFGRALSQSFKWRPQGRAVGGGRRLESVLRSPASVPEAGALGFSTKPPLRRNDPRNRPIRHDS